MLTPTSMKRLYEYCLDDQCYEDQRRPSKRQQRRSRRPRRKSTPKKKHPGHGMSARRIKRPDW